MPEDFDDIIEEGPKEEVDCISLGKAMRKIRTAAGKKQEDAAKIFMVSRTVYTKYETGTVKPNPEDLKAFARANVRRCAHKNEGIILNAGRQMHVSRPEEIVTIESDRHYTLLTEENGEETRIHIGCSDVISKFPKSFFGLRRGIAVNMDHISRINSDSVTLSNGGRYTAARSRLDQVVSCYTRFISETY